jgi:hypothetical protein
MDSKQVNKILLNEQSMNSSSVRLVLSKTPRRVKLCDDQISMVHMNLQQQPSTTSKPITSSSSWDDKNVNFNGHNNNRATAL